MRTAAEPRLRRTDPLGGGLADRAVILEVGRGQSDQGEPPSVPDAPLVRQVSNSSHQTRLLSAARKIGVGSMRTRTGLRQGPGQSDQHDVQHGATMPFLEIHTAEFG